MSDKHGEFITIARVSKTQGRIGEVATELFTDFPEKFAERKKVFALLPHDGRRELELEDAWSHKGQMVLKFAGVDSITEAESLIGCEIQILKQDRAVLSEGAVWISDLIGSTVTDHGNALGKVKDVQFGFGEAPMLIVQSGSTDLMVPYATAFIVKQDLNAKCIDMNLPEGLLDVDAMLDRRKKQRQSGKS